MFPRSDDEQVLIVRIYGNNLDLLVDREIEIQPMVRLSQQDLASQILLTFNSGFLYTYVPGEQIGINDESVDLLVANKLAKYHFILSNDNMVPAPSQHVLNFTLLLKNFIVFPRFHRKISNTEILGSHVKGCNYDPVKHKTCPICRIGTLLDIVEPDQNEQQLMLTNGGIILIDTYWKCSSNRCLPYYSFGRSDIPYKDEPFSSGFNFRFASYWKQKHRSFRTLTVASGLRFIVSVRGHAERFNFIVLLWRIGFLIGVICLITFIFDKIGQHIYCRLAVDRSQDVAEESKRKTEPARLTE